MHEFKPLLYEKKYKMIQFYRSIVHRLKRCLALIGMLLKGRRNNEWRKRNYKFRRKKVQSGSSKKCPIYPPQVENKNLKQIRSFLSIPMWVRMEGRGIGKKGKSSKGNHEPEITNFELNDRLK